MRSQFNEGDDIVIGKNIINERVADIYIDDVQRYLLELVKTKNVIIYFADVGILLNKKYPDAEKIYNRLGFSSLRSMMELFNNIILGSEIPIYSIIIKSKEYSMHTVENILKEKDVEISADAGNLLNQHYLGAKKIHIRLGFKSLRQMLESFDKITLGSEVHCYSIKGV